MKKTWSKTESNSPKRMEAVINPELTHYLPGTWLCIKNHCSVCIQSTASLFAWRIIIHRGHNTANAVFIIISFALFYNPSLQTPATVNSSVQYIMQHYFCLPAVVSLVGFAIQLSFSSDFVQKIKLWNISSQNTKLQTQYCEPCKNHGLSASLLYWILI